MGETTLNSIETVFRVLVVVVVVNYIYSGYNIM